MAKSKEIRTVRMDQLKKQYADRVIGEGSLVRVEISAGEYVWIKLPIMLAEDDDFPDRLRAAGVAQDSEELALVVLSGHPDHTAEEQWEKWKASGFDASDLALAFKSELDAAQDRQSDFRYAG